MRTHDFEIDDNRYAPPSVDRSGSEKEIAASARVFLALLLKQCDTETDELYTSASPPRTLVWLAGKAGWPASETCPSREELHAFAEGSSSLEMQLRVAAHLAAGCGECWQVAFDPEFEREIRERAEAAAARGVERARRAHARATKELGLCVDRGETKVSYIPYELYGEVVEAGSLTHDDAEVVKTRLDLAASGDPLDLTAWRRLKGAFESGEIRPGVPGFTESDLRLQVDADSRLEGRRVRAALLVEEEDDWKPLNAQVVEQVFKTRERQAKPSAVFVWRIEGQPGDHRRCELGVRRVWYWVDLSDGGDGEGLG